MKNIMYVICIVTLMSIGFTASAQTYKTAADTVKLNKEFTEVSNDIASLTAKLTIAQNNLPGLKSKAVTANSDAKDAAATSSTQADKATRGDIDDAKKAKQKSKKAFREAKDARSAGNDVDNLDDKIASLSRQLAKKQVRLEQLTAMRVSIGARLPH